MIRTVIDDFATKTKILCASVENSFQHYHQNIFKTKTLITGQNYIV